MSKILESLKNNIDQISPYKIYGKISSIQGMLVEISGVHGYLAIGDRCLLENKRGKKIICEIVGFKKSSALALPYDTLDGVSLGGAAEIISSNTIIKPTKNWLGRIINAFGEEIDGKGRLPNGNISYNVRNNPPPANKRNRIGSKIDLGIKALNSFLSCCRGQRMGIFAGSGVGKSILMSMLSRYCSTPVIVIGLIGERGREVQEFIQDDLGEEGLARSVVVVATSDESPLMRREAAYMTMAVAEYFRDRGDDVLCLMDSVTRFAMAQREIGLSIGEPPATKGYTPTVFSELPRLLERAGPGIGDNGSITGLFTVLVEGDDHNEPISDAVRGILDGHIVLDRQIAQRNRYPAINILRSVSRSMPKCNTDKQNEIVNRARQLISAFDDMAELIRLGAYKKGSDKLVDEAIHYNPLIEEFLNQKINQKSTLEEGYSRLAEILEIEYP